MTGHQIPANLVCEFLHLRVLLRASSTEDPVTPAGIGRHCGSACDGRSFGAASVCHGTIAKVSVGLSICLDLEPGIAIDAALSGSRNDLLKAILAHPLVNSVDAAEKAMDELLARQADWLPQFRQ